MIKAHQYKTLQLITDRIWDTAECLNSMMNEPVMTDGKVEDALIQCDFLLESIALWKANYSEWFAKTKGVKIRD